MGGNLKATFTGGFKVTGNTSRFKGDVFSRCFAAVLTHAVLSGGYFGRNTHEVYFCRARKEKGVCS